MTTTAELATEQATNEACRLHALIVEDNPDDSELILHELRRAGFDVTSDTVQSPDQFRQKLHDICPDIVLADYNLGSWRGIEATRILREESLDVPVVLVSGALGDVLAVECIKQGATDYVLKDQLQRLPISVRRALQEKHLRRQRKNAEDDLASKMDELARSNADLEQFAYVASHDLQEPLRMIAAYTQLLVERYRGRFDENADKYITYIVDGAIRMQSMIDDLLAFSRAGRQGLELKSIECSTVIRQAIHNLQAAMHESGASVRYGRMPVVMANPTQLQQVFQNLIANAIKFRSDKPPIISVDAEERDHGWVIAVADNGIGIAPEHIDDVFVMFRRLHTRAEYAGNGIGLAICKRVIERHGGKVWVVSQPGNGSTFYFTLADGRTTHTEGNNHTS